MLFLISKYLRKLRIKIPENFLKEEIVRWYADNYSERIIEYPLVFASLPKSKSKILDVGCRYSKLSIQLASLAHEVYGIDLFRYKMKHPNFTFIQGYILEPPFKKNFFDVIISVSTIEHIGLSFYGEEGNPVGDHEAVRSIYRLLKPGGMFLMTVPFGVPRDTFWYRIYNCERLESLLKNFGSIDLKTYEKSDNGWIDVDPKIAQEKLSFSGEVEGVVFVKAIKKK